jgi:hypothetical protein
MIGKELKLDDLAVESFEVADVVCVDCHVQYTDKDHC